MKETRPLAEMQRAAADMVALLAPYCRRIAVAGSVRRAMPECRDIELVAQPEMLPAGLFGDQQTSALHRFLTVQGVVFTKGNNPEGRYHQVQMLGGVQVDLFLATERNWGWLLLLRTGSAEFSQVMLTRWKAGQRIGPDGKGSVDGHLVTKTGQVVETPTEESVFALCHTPWVAPEERTGRLGGGALYAGGEGRA